MRRGWEGAQKAADMTNAGSVAAPAGTVTGTATAADTATSFVVTTVSIPDATDAAALRVSSAVDDVAAAAALPGTRSAPPTATYAARDGLVLPRDDPWSRSTSTAAASVAASVLNRRGNTASSTAPPALEATRGHGTRQTPLRDVAGSVVVLLRQSQGLWQTVTVARSFSDGPSQSPRL